MINLEQIKADVAARKAMPAWGPQTSIERIKTINATLPSFSLKTVEALVEMLESRTVTVKLPPKIERDDATGWFMYNGGRVGGGAAEWYNKALDDVSSVMATTGTSAEDSSVDADVSDRNQPGMVVAVHIDVGDFVKFSGQVYEVKETYFDDHDVTLWFVCGEALKCAAGCQIEVVSAPGEAE